MDISQLFIENWEVVFLYAFKYLKDIKMSLEQLHLDNTSNTVKIENLERRVSLLESDRK